MLINFTFENFKSFKDEQTFTMKRLDESPYDTARWSMPSVSPVAVVYGANASGKSNILHALRYVRTLVDESFRSGDGKSGIERHPHLLDPVCPDAESTYLIEFSAKDGLRYVYWFSVGTERVEYEELNVYRSKQPTNLFRRCHEDGRAKVVFGPTFKGPKSQMEKLTRPNSLFISVAAACGSAVVAPAYEFLTDDVQFYDAPAYRSEIPAILAHVDSGDQRGRQLAALVRYADFGIEDLDKRERSIAENERALMRNLARLVEGIPEEALDDLVETTSKELSFKHRGVGGSRWLGQEDQSDGTIAALAFFNVVLDALAEGAIVLVDEIEKSLHPTIVRELIDLFRDPATNPLQAQLVFTTHDTSLINEPGSVSKLLQRDQIWLVEKDREGASSLLPLTAFGVRKQDNFGRNYLNGAYGAIPSLTFHAAIAQIVAQAADIKAGDKE